MNDLKFMQDFCAEEAPPSTDRLAAVRARVVAGFDEASQGRQRALRRAGVVAAAVIVPGTGTRQGAGAIHLTAATVLQRAAQAALTAPSPGANQFLYTDTVSKDPRNTPKEWVTREWVSITKGYQGIDQMTSCVSTTTRAAGCPLLRWIRCPSPTRG